MEYTFLDSGFGQKLERFGDITLIRPAAQALWRPHLPESEWKKAHARFSRIKENSWDFFRPIPEEWTVLYEKIRFKLRATDFGHLGLFPEHGSIWRWMKEQILSASSPPRVLNLFAYSGGASLVAASLGASVCHLDASKGMVSWASENASINGLSKAPIRWIVDDVRKFLKRALNRGEKYELILLDPPTFGRGKAQEIFKIERDLPDLLQACANLLSDKPLGIALTCHTPGYTPLILKQLLQEVLPKGSYEMGDLLLNGFYDLPSGSVAKWMPLC